MAQHYMAKAVPHVTDILLLSNLSSETKNALNVFKCCNSWLQYYSGRFEEAAAGHWQLAEEGYRTREQALCAIVCAVLSPHASRLALKKMFDKSRLKVCWR